MKRKLHSRFSVVLALILMFTMMPVYAFGATKTLKDDTYNEFHIGQNYDVKLKVGDKPMYCCIECDYGEDYDSDDYPYLISAENSNASVVKLFPIDGDGSDMYFELKGLNNGTAKITVKFSTGQTSVFNVSVNNGSSSSDQSSSSDSSTKTTTKPKTKTMKSSSPRFRIGTNYNLTVKMGKEYSICCSSGGELYSVKSSKKKIASVSLDYFDEFTLKAKLVGKTTITVKDENGDKTVIHVTVKPGKAKIEAHNWVYKNTTKVPIDVWNAVKGDKIKLKIGTKTYTKKITKTAKKQRVTIKIKKPGFYGKKYKLTLVRKKKTVAKEVQYVFLSNYVHIGDTKSKVKWLTYWNDPDRKNKSAYSEQWCYDWDGDGLYDAYLYFQNGKVYNWQTYE